MRGQWQFNIAMATWLVLKEIAHPFHLYLMKEIGLKAAIRLADTELINGRLHTFSIAYYKQDGEFKEKENVCKKDPEGSDKIEEVTRETRQAKRLRYDYVQQRTVRFFDLATRQNFSVSTDLWVAINGIKINHDK
ncbi:hypothetical protein [Flexithrix dorotheae]|uniref:hypothetical protein n=1 Tax=Flexithrix dorotheae TaxID=70993 RepID=UPI00036D02A4|nr:hypothetical protein [Flexithrix dorotheae]